VRVEGNRVDVTIEVDRHDDLLNAARARPGNRCSTCSIASSTRAMARATTCSLRSTTFWQQREVELETLARSSRTTRIAHKLRVVSDYLNRRAPHRACALKEQPRETFSLGTGMVKRVAVAPASFPERSRTIRS